MYSYIKVNPKVAEFLGVLGKRPQFPDGNVMLWKFDLLPLGGNTDEVLSMIGGVGFTSTQCRKEQQKVSTTALPEPTDARFRITKDEK